MSKPKAVLGKYVYLNIPPRPEFKIKVDQNTKEALEKEWIAKLDKLEVYAVGVGADSNIKEGEFVLVDPQFIQQIKMVPMGDGEDPKALVTDYMIVHVW